MIAPGAHAALEMTVTPADTAQALGSGEVPVLATPRLLALMEAATLRAVGTTLPEGSTTVGSEVVLSHSAPSGVGTVVDARAELEDVEGRRLRFRVVASSSGTLVGTATITRVVVDRQRFGAEGAT